MGRRICFGREALTALWCCSALLEGSCSGRLEVDENLVDDGGPSAPGADIDASSGRTPDRLRDSGTGPRDAAPRFEDAAAEAPDGARDAGAVPHESSPVHRWVAFEAGTFLMGSPAGEACREGASPSWKEDLHEVTLTRPFEMSVNETTRRQFLAVMGYLPTESVSCDDEECPISRINWSEASAYCDALNGGFENPAASCYECTGSGREVSCRVAPAYAGDFTRCLGYRLPTDAEWEYAYRAGTTSPLYNGKPVSSCSGRDDNADPIAWYRGNSGDRAHPVGQKAPNPAGLYDMGGNVWNWTHDWAVFSLGTAPATDPSGPTEATEGAWRIVRGGSYHYYAHNVRAARRTRYGTEGRSPATGVRCVRTLADSPIATLR